MKILSRMRIDHRGIIDVDAVTLRVGPVIFVKHVLGWKFKALLHLLRFSSVHEHLRSNQPA